MNKMLRISPAAAKHADYGKISTLLGGDVAKMLRAIYTNFQLYVVFIS